MRRTIALLAAFSFTQTATYLHAANPGTTGAEILKYPVGVRAIGMGEAYTAQADDVSSLYWNPAGLALMKERQASFSHAALMQDINLENASIGIPLRAGGLGANVSYLNYGPITGYDTVGTPTGNQPANSTVGTLGGALLGEQWSAGMNVKGIQEKLAQASATTAALDLGAMGIYPRPLLGGTLRVGGAIKNIGKGIQFDQQRDPLPREWRMGVAMVELMRRTVNVSMDYVKPIDDKGAVSGGFEYWAHKMVALRMGYVGNNTEGSGLRLGAGLRFKRVSFDYAYSGQGRLGLSHLYEMSFRFGEPRHTLSPEEIQMYRQAKSDMRKGRNEQAVLLLDSLLQMEPGNKQARKDLNKAMSRLEKQESQAVAHQGKAFEPATPSRAKKTVSDPMEATEEDNLKDLLNMGTPQEKKKSPDSKEGAPQ